MNPLNTLKALALSALVITAQGAFAQAKKAEPRTFHLHIEKEENGNKEVIDRTFSSKEEMEAYIAENKIEKPDMDLPDVPEAPAVPTPPTPPAKPKTIIIEKRITNGEEKREEKRDEKKGDKKVKKIIIIEKEEGVNGNPKLEIQELNLTPEDRAMILQKLIELKGITVQLGQSKDDGQSMNEQPGQQNLCYEY